MVSLEFEKPSTWSIGKKIGALAAVILLIGGALSFSICFPILTIILIVILFYMKFDIYLEKEKDMTRVRINHFILIAWSALYFIIYLLQAVFWAAFTSGFESNYFTIMGIGLWLTTLGFLFCIIAGVLEWRYPIKGAPLAVLGKRKEKEVVTEVSAEPAPEIATTSNIEKPVTVVKTEPSRGEQVVEPGPVSVAPTAEVKKIETLEREPTTDEEKMLLKWASHINEYGQTFEKCTKCNNYVFLRAKDTGDTIVFNCPDCGASYTLKK